MEKYEEDEDAAPRERRKEHITSKTREREATAINLP